MECRICQAVAPGFHYKIASCRACAAFFRRTVQMKLRYKCRRGGECDVSKRNRFSCRHCRMKKCLEVGMIMEEAEVPPHFHLDPSEPSASDLPSMDEDDIYRVESLFGDHEGFMKKFKQQMYRVLEQRYSPPENGFDMYIIPQAELSYKMHEEKWPCSKETMIETETFDMNLFIMLGYKALKVVAQFCIGIKAFAALPLDQKTLIFRHFFVKFLQLDRTFVGVTLLGNDREDKRMITIHGHVLNFYDMKMDLSMVTEMSHEQLKELLLLSEIKYDVEFIQPFKLLDPDRFEVLYMMMRSMWEVQGLKGISKDTERIATEMLDKLSDELCFYYKYEKRLENVADRIYKLHMLLIGLDRVAQLRKQDSQMVQVFEIFKMDVYLTEFTIDK